MRFKNMFFAAFFLAGCGDEQFADGEAPAAVEDLLARTMSESTAVLTWTAPGDNGDDGRAERYDVRYGVDMLTSSNWSVAAAWAPAPIPRAAGWQETLLVAGLPHGRWWFGLRASDAASNWSALSNIVSLPFGDPLPPAAVQDLQVTTLQGSDVTLEWTAPGDDGSDGQAAQYEMRKANAPITSANWATAALVPHTPVPSPAGTVQTGTVRGLTSPECHFFAIRTSDEVGQWSPLSNVASVALGLVRLTTLPASDLGGALYPSWRRDGQAVVFSAYWYVSNEIFVMAPGGGSPVQMTNDLVVDYQPRWSPDGTKIAFTRKTSSRDRPQIWIMAAVPRSSPHRLTNESVSEEACDWSPDGTKIVYTRSLSLTSAGEIVVVPAEGGEPVKIADGMWPRWSPDGVYIAFTVAQGDNQDIWVVPASGGVPAQITGSPFHDSFASWSPEGNRLAFQSDRSGNFDIWIINRDGSHVTRVTDDPANDVLPAWAPDGTRILFSSNRTGANEIWTQQLQP